MAEDAARELPNLSLEDALQLVHLYAERVFAEVREGGAAVARSLFERGHADLEGRREGHIAKVTASLAREVQTLC